jgi:hypothetical protein
MIPALLLHNFDTTSCRVKWFLIFFWIENRLEFHFPSNAVLSLSLSATSIRNRRRSSPSQRRFTGVLSPPSETTALSLSLSLSLSRLLAGHPRPSRRSATLHWAILHRCFVSDDTKKKGTLAFSLSLRPDLLDGFFTT